MRDPLQTEPALDELLALPGRASEREVNAAFARALVDANRADVPRLTAARKLLLKDPVECALLRALRYDDEWLRLLDPCPLDDPACMSEQRRAKTAERWEALLRDRFPDPALMHCLAVEWYWWACAVSHGEASPEGQDLAELWRRAIAYWAALAADKTFLQTLLGSRSEDGQVFVTKLVDKLRRQIHEALLAPPGSSDLRELDARLSTEIRSARIAAEITGSGRSLPGGVMLLERLGRAESMRQLIQSSGRSDDDVRWLAELLSPLGEVVVLLDARRVPEALVALEKLTETERRTSEAASLLVRAYTMHAKHQVELGRVEEAIDAYEQALAHAPHDAREGIRAAIRAAATGKAVMASGGPAADEAIKVLDRAHAIASDDHLAALLGDRLTDRGVRRFREGQEALEKAEGEATESTKRKLRAGLKDLKRAKELGSVRAVEQLGIAEQFYRAVLDGKVDGGRDGALPPKVIEHMKRASEAAQREDWDESVRNLRLASKAMGDRPQGEIQQAIAIALVNRAMSKANAAISKANAAISSAPAHSPPLVPLMDAWRELSEALDDLSEAKKENPRLKGIDSNIDHVRQNRDAIAAVFGMPAGFEFPRADRGSRAPKEKTGWQRKLGKVLQYAVMLTVGALILFGIDVLADNSPTFKSVMEGIFVVGWVVFLLWSLFSR